jgi:Flp pilus assembly protein TadG
MKRLAMPGSLIRLRRVAARLVHDRRGNAATEFAMIVPLMLVLFFGTVEFSSGIAVKRKVSMVTGTLGDLVSRYKDVSDTDIVNFDKIADAILTPYSATPLKATISELYIDPSTGDGRVQWSKGDVALAVGSPVVVPDVLIARDAAAKIKPDQYLIFAEASYLYVPAVGYVMAKAGVTLSDKIFMKPRLSSCVYNPPSAVGTTPPCPKTLTPP